MKKRSVVLLLPATFLFNACSTPENKVTGKWVMAFPEHKMAMLDNIYEENLREIEKIDELPEEARAYNINSLDSFKQIARNELKMQYDLVLERNRSIQYDFTKDGHVLMTNLKQNKTDTVYNFKVAEEILTLIPHRSAKTETETGFSDTTKLNIFRLNADSMVLTKSSNNFTDTFIYISQNQK